MVQEIFGGIGVPWGQAYSAGRARIERLPGRHLEAPFELDELLRVIARVAKSA